MPEAQVHSEVGASVTDISDEARFVQALQSSLHELSQPMTVLLCTLEYGGSLESVAEVKEMLTVSQEACDRLRKIVVSMQALARKAMEEVAVKE